LQWETKRVLVTVKAYPEVSKAYGEIVCLAGITDNGEFIRLYPVPFELFRGKDRIRKYTWVDAKCAKVDDYQHRKDSYKVKTEFGKCMIKKIDESLTGISGKTPWDQRSKIVLPLVSSSLEDLESRFSQDKSSLGLIKIQDLLDFYSKKPIEEIEIERSMLIQKTLFGGSRTLLDKIPHIFYYKFHCSPDCTRIHDISIEDWEVFESFRSWSDIYLEKEILWQKLRQRYYEDFKEKNLHFFMGTHSRWPIWMIIGAYYPPKIRE